MSIKQIKVKNTTIYIETFPSDVIGLCNMCKEENGKLLGSLQTSKLGDKRVSRLGRMCDKCLNHFNNLDNKGKLVYLSLCKIKRKI